MNEEDMKGFIESLHKKHKMDSYEWDSYQKEETIHKNLYNDIYEEVMSVGMNTTTYPRMYALVKWEDPDQTRHATYIFAVRDNEIPEVFRDGEFSVMSFMDMDHARGFYVRLCKTGWEEVKDRSALTDMKKVYKHYQDQRKGQNSDYALNA